MSSIFEKRRSPEEVEEDGLKMRTGEPGRGAVGAVEKLAFGNDGVVEAGAGVVGQSDGGTGGEGEEVLENMELEEAVEEGEEKEGGGEEVVRGWNEGEGAEEEGVRGGGRGPIQIRTQFHGTLLN